MPAHTIRCGREVVQHVHKQAQPALGGMGPMKRGANCGNACSAHAVLELVLWGLLVPSRACPHCAERAR